jgi:hypothetical protein
VRSRTSMPETGDAVEAMRIIDCERDMSYLSRPRETRGQKSCTALPIACSATAKPMNRCRLAKRDS